MLSHKDIEHTHAQSFRCFHLYRHIFIDLRRFPGLKLINTDFLYEYEKKKFLNTLFGYFGQ